MLLPLHCAAECAGIEKALSTINSEMNCMKPDNVFDNFILMPLVCLKLKTEL